MNENKTRSMMKDVFNGLRYLHDIGIVHRDIKLENVMMSSLKPNGVPKFIDFGLSKVFTPNEKSSDPYGTIAYCSPEIIL